jgi:hypothetical protein
MFLANRRTARTGKELKTCYLVLKSDMGSDSSLLARLDWPPFLITQPVLTTQPVKTRNPFIGELSHGVVEKDVHQGVQAGGGAAAGTREFDWGGGAGAGSKPERAALLAA